VLSRITQWTIVCFIACTFHFLQYCNASVQSVDPLPKHGFESVNADFVKNFSDYRKKFIRIPELLSLEVIFEMPKQETKKSQRELSPTSKMDLVDVADVVQFARNCHHKTLSSLLLYVALHCLHARPTSLHLSLHAEQ
jgi:hypothetical protein